jgi:hypothetical protein
LDGSAYLARYNQGDAAAIAWLDRHAVDGDVLVEAPGCGYGTFGGVPMNRASAFTGIPAVLGWRNHEGQWRRGVDDVGPLLDARQAAANAWLDGLALEAGGDPRPRFIVVGAQELEGSSSCDLVTERSADVYPALEEAGWQPAFESSGTRIYVRADDPSLTEVESAD